MMNDIVTFAVGLVGIGAVLLIAHFWRNDLNQRRRERAIKDPTFKADLKKSLQEALEKLNNDDDIGLVPAIYNFIGTLFKHKFPMSRS